MARWTVVRVLAEDGMAAQATITRAFAPVTMSVDMQPPATGPEWEIAVQDRSEEQVCRLLDATGITVLASKTILKHALVPPGGVA
jgi:hypothetical protein